MAQAQRKHIHLDPEIKARLAATISRVHGAPVDPDSPYLLQQFASILRQRAGAGWNTPLSPETAMVVADALYAYAPKPPVPPYRGPDRRFQIELSKGSAIYRMLEGEIFEIEAWAKSTSAARAAFNELANRNPKDHYMQKRGSWVEGDTKDDHC